MSMQPELDSVRRQVDAVLQAYWRFFLIQGIVLVVLGLLAVALPQIATVAIEMLIGSLFLIGGVVRVIAVLRTRHAPGYGWSLVVGGLAAALGLLLLVQHRRWRGPRRAPSSCLQ